MYGQCCCEIKKNYSKEWMNDESWTLLWSTWTFNSDNTFSLYGLLNWNESAAVLQREWKKFDWLVVEPTHRKNMLVKLGSSSPRIYHIDMSANMCWQHIQRWSFWSKRVCRLHRHQWHVFHYIYQRSQDTSQQRKKHVCIAKTQSSEDLPAGFAIAIKDSSSKMISPSNFEGFRGETIRSYEHNSSNLDILKH